MGRLTGLAMGGGGEEVEGTGYSRLTGLIYIFNLIVGTGALTLPAAFKDAGYVLATILLVLLAFMSYLTATFVIESMAAANALLRWRRVQRQKRGGDEASRRALASRPLATPLGSPVRRGGGGGEGEREPLVSGDEEERTGRRGYEITEITEMGRMASLFFNRWGRNLFYVCLAVYLYGDLAIYGAAVAKSVRDVSCSHTSNSTNLTDASPCWSGGTTRLQAYRIILAIFTLTIGQFVFCNVTKTKYLQVMISVMVMIMIK